MMVSWGRSSYNTENRLLVLMDRFIHESFVTTVMNQDIIQETAQSQTREDAETATATATATETETETEMVTILQRG